MKFALNEIEHRYGQNIHILNDPSLSGWLGRLCSPETTQPLVNTLVNHLYGRILTAAVNAQLPKVRQKITTRMTSSHPGHLLDIETLAPQTRAVVVNLARAGTYPSHICYDLLNYLLDPQGIRQDHIFASRVTDKAHQVTGTALDGAKIGGDVEGAFVLIPDPMGATGNTLISTVSHYKNNVDGRAAKFIALHLIVTPEYLKNVHEQHPDLIVYALRLDRGLSSEKILQTVPGEFWEQERGLNDQQYIVPGGGGFGEIMNNSFV
jgi:uracil phosphoribosyltransferase